MAAGDFQGSPVHAQPVASPGVTISETSLEIEEENTALYTVVLDTEPAGYVGVSIGGVGGTDLTLNRAQLFFTVQNWNVPQTVAVTANHDRDGIDEADVTLTHTVSSPDDGDYDGLSAAGVTVTVTDDDYPALRTFQVSEEIEEGDSNLHRSVVGHDAGGHGDADHRGHHRHGRDPRQFQPDLHAPELVVGVKGSPSRWSTMTTWRMIRRSSSHLPPVRWTMATTTASNP